MGRRLKKMLSKWPSAAATVLALYGCAVPTAAGLFWLTHRRPTVQDHLWGISLGWFMLSSVSALLIAAALLFFISGRVRWLSMLQKCVIVALLGHLVFGVAVELAVVWRYQPKKKRRQERTPLSLRRGLEQKVSGEIRQRPVADMPIHDPTLMKTKPVELPPTPDPAPKPPEVDTPPAETREKAWEVPALTARKTPPPEPAVQKPPPLDPKAPSPPTMQRSFRKVAQRERPPEPRRREPPELKQKETQRAPADSRRLEIKPEPARPERESMTSPAEADRQPPETQRPVELKARPLEQPRLAVRPPESEAPPVRQDEERPAPPTLSMAEPKPAGAEPAPPTPREVALNARSSRPAGDSLARPVTRQADAPSPADARAPQVRPVAGERISAAPAEASAPPVRRDEQQPRGPRPAEAAGANEQLARTPAPAPGSRQIESDARPAAAQAGGSLAAARQVQRRPPKALEAPSSRLKPTVGTKLAAAPPGVGGAAGEQTEAAPDAPAPGIPAGRLAGAAPVITGSPGGAQVDAGPANVGQEHLILAAGMPTMNATGAPGPSASVKIQPPPGGRIQAAPAIQDHAPVARREDGPSGPKAEDLPTGLRLAEGPPAAPQRLEAGRPGLMPGPAGAGDGSPAASLAGPAATSPAAPGEAAGEAVSLKAAGAAGAAGPAVEGPSLGPPLRQDEPEAGGGIAPPSLENEMLAAGGSLPSARVVQAAGGAAGPGAEIAGSLASAPGAPGAAPQAYESPGAMGPLKAGGQSPTGGQIEVSGPPGEAPAKVTEPSETPGQGGIVGGDDPALSLGKRQVGAPAPGAADVDMTAPAAGSDLGSIAASAAAGLNALAAIVPAGLGPTSPRTPAEGSRTPAGAPELDAPGAGRGLRGDEEAPGAGLTAEIPHAGQAAAGPAPRGASEAVDLAAIGEPAGAEAIESLLEIASAGGQPEGELVGGPLALAPSSAGTEPEGLPRPRWLDQRKPTKRQEIIGEMGGSEETEGSVAIALEFLAKSQEPDGRWTYFTGSPDPGRHGKNPRDMGITGLTLLCFLAADHTPAREGPYRQVVAKGLDFLISQQKPDGDLRGSGGHMYSHGMATLAVAEAAVMTGNARHRASALKAARFIVDAQDPDSGGWRYQPRQSGDTSILGWQVMALYTVKHLGVEIPDETREGALRWLDHVSTKSPSGILAGYVDSTPQPAMSAEAAFSRILLGQRLTEAQEKEVCDYLLKFEPGEMKDNVWSKDNFYFWYYTALALIQMQNDAWRKWNPLMQKRLLALQHTEGELKGSWEPDTLYSGHGGRVYATAIAALTLEVYYRYLPFFARPADRSDASDKE